MCDMAQLSKAPIRLIALLRERLSSEDMRLIAEDYGEHCGSEKSLYDQLEAKAGEVDLIPRLLVLHAIHRKNLMLLVRVISERCPDLRKALRSFGFEQSTLVKDYLVALRQELGDTEDGGAVSSDTLYVIRKTDAFLVARE